MKKENIKYVIENNYSSNRTSTAIFVKIIKTNINALGILNNAAEKEDVIKDGVRV